MTRFTSINKVALKRSNISYKFASHIAQTGHLIKRDKFTFIDEYKYQNKNRQIEESLCLNAFSNCGDAIGRFLKLKEGDAIGQLLNLACTWPKHAIR